jgi:hypothetical protein
VGWKRTTRETIDDGVACGTAWRAVPRRRHAPHELLHHLWARQGERGADRLDAKRGVEPVLAQLSPVWTRARWSQRELRSIVSPRYRRRIEQLPRSIDVRLFLAVVPAGLHGLRPRVTLRDGRVLRPWD